MNLKLVYAPEVVDAMETAAVAPGMGIAVGDGLLVVLFRRSPTRQTLERRIHYIKRAIARSSGPFPVVIVIDEHAKGSLPGAESRKETKRQMSEFREHIACVATVIESQSLQFTLLRTLLRSVAVAVRIRQRSGFFSNVTEADQWCSKIMAQSLPITQAVIDLRKITEY